ncbi:MAG: hypothetical protein HY817_03985 [Candidatus Abawacabacteria bacterium]|nr:hypothetical protein [Candidatus Abawacabacteria bacterium]
MPQRYSLKNSPSFDLTNFHLVTTDITEVLARGVLFCESNEVFSFDHIYALIVPRSRVLRVDKQESERVMTIACALIDAGFVGKLVWKIVLTPFALQELQAMQKQGVHELAADYLSYFREAQQVVLFPCASGNYYNGSNQTGLSPDIIFGF